MKQFLTQAVLFVLIIAIPVIGADLSLQQMRPYQWFNGYANMLRNRKLDFLFMGSSIINAAVRPDQFAEMTTEPGKPPKVAINLGQGYTTPVEYLLGLKRMVERNPHVLEGCCVFMPATGGLADRRTWNDDWMDWHQPALLADLIDYPDLWRYLRKDNISFSEKILLIAAKHSSIVAQGGLLRAAAMHEQDLLAEYITHGGKLKPHRMLVIEEGGIRTDEEAIACMIATIIKQAAADENNQSPVDWRKTVVNDIVQFVQQHGGKMCFCYIPVSTIMLKPLSTPIRQKDIQNFERIAREWGCEYYKPDFHIESDRDFPDLTHVSASKADEYTKALAEAYKKRAAQSNGN